MPTQPAPDSLEGLYATLKAQFKNNEQPALLDALNAVNRYTAKLRTPDKFKRIPYVTEEDKQELVRLHKRVAEESEKLMKQTANKEILGIMEKIFPLASRNFTNISGYDPAIRPKSIDTIDEEVRALHLDMPEKPKKGEVATTVGKTLSERKMITFLNEKGKKVSGLFTPARRDAVYMTLMLELDKIADMTAGKYAEISDLLANVGKDSKLPENSILKTSEFEILYTLMSNITDYDPTNHGYTVNTNKLKNYMAKLSHTSPGELVNRVGAGRIERVESLLNDYATQVMANMEQAGISDDSRIDTRNAAMSAAADLFGMPNLVARSRPMKLTVRDKDGMPVELEGTFMLEAKGVDLNNLKTHPERLTARSLEGTDGNALRQLADLQVLDFICGNVDRHMGNIFYQIDEKTGKLIGIQGIDNDCSFGEFVPEQGESRRRLAGLANMRCISASMAKKVTAMTPATLKYSLRGYGLTEKQLDAACRRLELTQKAIQESLDHPVEGKNNGKPTFEKGKIRILPDDQFKNVDMKDLVVYTNKEGKEVTGAKEYGNIFACAYTAITDTKNRQSSQTSYTVKGSTVLNENNRCRVTGLENAQKELDTLKRAMGRHDDLFHSSGKYRDMKRAAKDLYDYQKKILTRVKLATGEDVMALPNYSQQLNAVVTPKEVTKMAKLAQKLEKAAAAYLKYKGISDGSKKLQDYSVYTQCRIEAAEGALKTAGLYKEVKPEEADLARVSERQAKEALARVKGDAKDPAMKNQSQTTAPQIGG